MSSMEDTASQERDVKWPTNGSSVGYRSLPTGTTYNSPVNDSALPGFDATCYAGSQVREIVRGDPAH